MKLLFILLVLSLGTYLKDLSSGINYVSIDLFMILVIVHIIILVQMY